MYVCTHIHTYIHTYSLNFCGLVNCTDWLVLNGKSSVDGSLFTNGITFSNLPFNKMPCSFKVRGVAFNLQTFLSKFSLFNILYFIAVLETPVLEIK